VAAYPVRHPLEGKKKREREGGGEKLRSPGSPSNVLGARESHREGGKKKKKGIESLHPLLDISAMWREGKKKGERGGSSFSPFLFPYPLVWMRGTDRRWGEEGEEKRRKDFLINRSFCFVDEGKKKERREKRGFSFYLC